MPLVTSQISQSSDDGTESGAGTVTLNSATISVVGSTQWMATRFEDITIPRLATISAASLTVNVVDTAADDAQINLYAEAANNSVTLTTAANNISSRARTTAFTAWSATSLGTGAKTSPDISAVIQEVTDRSGWASGNALTIIWDGLTAGNFSLYAWDGSPGLSALLSITYTLPEFQINGGAAFHGVSAAWERQRLRQNNDGTIEYQPYSLHTWDITQASATTFEALQALEGQVLTSLKTTDINSRNEKATYTDAEIIGVVSGQHEGRRMTSVRVTFKVKVG
jgi:hypothetical protein